MDDVILIAVMHPGYGPPMKSYTRRRAGIEFNGRELYKRSDFTEAQWKAIEADPQLDITDPYVEPKPQEPIKPNAAAEAEKTARENGERAYTPKEEPGWNKPRPPSPPVKTADPPRLSKDMKTKIHEDLEQKRDAIETAREEKLRKDEAERAELREREQKMRAEKEADAFAVRESQAKEAAERKAREAEKIAEQERKQKESIDAEKAATKKAARKRGRPAKKR